MRTFSSEEMALLSTSGVEADCPALDELTGGWCDVTLFSGAEPIRSETVSVSADTAEFYSVYVLDPMDSVELVGGFSRGRNPARALAGCLAAAALGVPPSRNFDTTPEEARDMAVMPRTAARRR